MAWNCSLPPIFLFDVFNSESFISSHVHRRRGAYMKQREPELSPFCSQEGKKSKIRIIVDKGKGPSGLGPEYINDPLPCPALGQFFHSVL